MSNEYLHVSCLIDHLKGVRNQEIPKAAEALSVSAQMNESLTNLPTAIQYTHGVANFARSLAEHSFKTAILFDSNEALEFTTELISDFESAFGHLVLIEDSIPVSNRSFPMSPDEEGWKVVILDDIVPFVGGDVDLTLLLRSISSTMKKGGNLIIRIAKLEDKKSWNKEYNDNVVTESIEKVGLRKYKRVFTSHGSIKLRHEEAMNSFDLSDLHDCARNAEFRPTRDLGLDSSVWCCYEKI